jgi:hypothetical protein
MENDIFDEFSRWDYYFDLIKKDEKLSEIEKASILDGWNKLRQIFGEEWLKQAITNRHPLFPQLLNQAPWQRFWIAEFGKMLDNLQTIDNFPDLKKRLLNPKEFSSAEAEFWVASILKKAGLLFKFVGLKGSKKKPDIITIMGDQEVFIEITTIATSEEVKKASQTLDALFYPFLSERVIVSGKIYKTLAPARRSELQRRIRECVDKVKNDGSPIEISEEGVIDCFIAPEDKTKELEEWVQKKKLGGIWEGPSWYVDEIKRIKGRITGKVRQIPAEKPGVIIIYDNCLVLQQHEPDFINKLVYELEDTVYEYPNLLGVAIVITQLSTRGEETLDENENYIYNKRTRNLVEKSTLILKNKYCGLEVIKTAGALWKSFIL